MKILFISDEVAPFVRRGEAGDVGRALPKTLRALGHDVRVVTPRYTTIRERQFGLREVARLRAVPVQTSGGEVICTFRSGFIPASHVQVYFVDNSEHFGRPEAFAEAAAAGRWDEVSAHCEFLSHSALQLALLLNWKPDIIHCNSWHTAMTPYLVRRHPLYHDALHASRCIYQLETNDLDYLPELKTGKSFSRAKPAEGAPVLNDKLNYIRLAIGQADAVVHLTPSHATIIKAPKGSTRKTQSRTGRSGVAARVEAGAPTWDPRRDDHLPVKYCADTGFAGKRANREHLLRQLGLSPDSKQPVVAVALSARHPEISELFHQISAELPNLPATFVILPSGERSLDASLKVLLSSRLGNCVSLPDRDEKLRHLVVAGSDMVLIPAPCPTVGFHQADSLLYGTVPVVGLQNGRADAVEDFVPAKGRGCGFTFDPNDPEDLLDALRRAVSLYQQPEVWKDLQHRGLSADFSWEASACQLLELYEQALQSPPSS